LCWFINAIVSRQRAIYNFIKICMRVYVANL
jgi:hypothetical protein